MKQITMAKRQGFWDLRAAGNFIGGGTGTGLLLVSAMAALTGRDVTLPMLVGAGCVMAGLSLVWLEIGKPWRALNVFFHPQTSWMTREGILAGPLALCVLGFVVTGHGALLIPVMVLALGFIYCQARILRASRGIPAWKQPEIVPFIMATALAEGSGAFLALGEASLVWIAPAVLSVLAREAAWWAYGRGLLQSKAPAATLASLKTPAARALRAAQWAGLVLILAAALTPASVAVLGGVLVMASGWGVKALLVTRAAFTRGPIIRHTPVRGRGLSRTVEA